MRKIYVWPDYNWVFKEDYCENESRYKGDDFLSMFVEEASDDDEIDRLVAEALGELGRQYRRQHEKAIRD